MKIVLVVLLAMIAAGAWWSTKPKTAAEDALAGLVANVENGEQVFNAGGCASCHADESSEDGPPVLSGGHRLVSDFGTFISPNISSDPVDGIGGWSALDLWNAMHYGTSPAGEHYYPAFPYSSYNKATKQDVVDLHAYLMTLPSSDTPDQTHELSFPFDIRLTLGGWKFLAMSEEWQQPAEGEIEERGRYLVEALGHCAECHTPRDLAGVLRRDQWMSGAPNPSGDGMIPALHGDDFDWSAEDIAYFLESGFTPSFDSAGGSMAEVVANFQKLSAADRNAVAAYIIALQ